MPESIVAVLGYARRPDDGANHVYSEMFLLHQPLDGSKKKESNLSNNQEVLTLLRCHKFEDRHVPGRIEKGDKEALSLGQW